MQYKIDLHTSLQKHAVCTERAPPTQNLIICLDSAEGEGQMPSIGPSMCLWLEFFVAGWRDCNFLPHSACCLSNWMDNGIFSWVNVIWDGAWIMKSVFKSNAGRISSGRRAGSACWPGATVSGFLPCIPHKQSRDIYPYICHIPTEALFDGFAIVFTQSTSPAVIPPDLQTRR